MFPVLQLFSRFPCKIVRVAYRCLPNLSRHRSENTLRDVTQISPVRAARKAARKAAPTDIVPFAVSRARDHSRIPTRLTPVSASIHPPRGYELRIATTRFPLLPAPAKLYRCDRLISSEPRSYHKRRPIRTIPDRPTHATGICRNSA